MRIITPNVASRRTISMGCLSYARTKLVQQMVSKVKSEEALRAIRWDQVSETSNNVQCNIPHSDSLAVMILPHPLIDNPQSPLRSIPSIPMSPKSMKLSQDFTDN